MPAHQKLNADIQWTITRRKGGVCYSGTSGPHTVYVTMGTPRDTNTLIHVVTQKRMERAIAQAAAANSLKPHEIVKTVIQAQPFHLATNAQNAWRVPDTGGDCQSIVRFTTKVADQVGCPGQLDIVKLYATNQQPTVAIDDGPNGGGLNWDYHPIYHPNNNTWRLMLIDGQTPPGCNAFEAAAKFTYCQETRYYPAGTSRVYDNADKVLFVFEKMSWVLEADLPTTCTPIDPPVYQYTPNSPW